MNSVISKDDMTPIAIVIPGLTSDSASNVSLRFILFYLSRVLVKEFMH